MGQCYSILSHAGRIYRGLKLAIERGWLEKHESGTYVSSLRRVPNCWHDYLRAMRGLRMHATAPIATEFQLPLPLLVRMHPNVRPCVLAGRLHGPAPITLVTTVTQFLVGCAGASRGAHLDRSNTHSCPSVFDCGAIPHVKHLGEIRFRTISALCLPCRFICAARRLGGNAKHANENRF